MAEETQTEITAKTDVNHLIVNPEDNANARWYVVHTYSVLRKKSKSARAKNQPSRKKSSPAICSSK